MFRPLFMPVSQAMKLESPWNSSRPDELTEKPVVGEAPVSHWNCVLGAGDWSASTVLSVIVCWIYSRVIMQPRPELSVIPPAESMQ